MRPFNATGNIIINMKGSINSVIDFTKVSSMAQKQLLTNESERLSLLGFTMQAFCTKELSKEDSLNIRQRIDSLSLFSKTFKEQLAKLCSDHLNNMTLAGVLGLQKIVPLRNTLTVQDMIDNSVKVWLLSQFSWRKTMTNCVNLNLMDDTQKIEVRGKNEREVEDCIRSAFNQVFDSEAKSK